MQMTDFLSLLGGLALFLYGMQMMSSGLEAAAGSRMKQILERLTANRFLGVLGGRGHHGGDPVVLRHHGHGGGLCQRGDDDPESGGVDHHGRQHRHHRHRGC